MEEYLEDKEFPVWFDYEVYNDTWDLSRAAERALSIDSDQASSFLGREGKYMIFSVWFKITSGGDIKGPYRLKQGEKL